jgi:hypothetical protein
MKALAKDALYAIGGAICVYVALSYGSLVKSIQVAPTLEVGSRLSSAAGLAAGTPRTLLIIGAESCPYSRSSLEFDRRLLAVAARRNISVLLVAPTKSSAEWYAQKLSVPMSSTFVRDLAALGVRGTPTVLLLDADRRVQGLWVGSLPQSQEKILLARLTGEEHVLEPPHWSSIKTVNAQGETVTPPKKLNVDTPPSFLDNQHYFRLFSDHVVIDPGERNSSQGTRLPGEKIIPLPELDVRARIELSREMPTVVDCTSVSIGECDLAAYRLMILGFQNVSVLDRGFRGVTCGVTPIGRE